MGTAAVFVLVNRIHYVPVVNFALTTRWNAGRHVSGETMIEEILDMGFSAVELGYDLRLDLVPGVEKMVESGAVKVDSVHNFCPLPIGAPGGHPELFTLASEDRRTREQAVHHTSETIRFAARIGATVVVTHVGNVAMKHMTNRLLDLCDRDLQFTMRYEKLRMKLQLKREKKARRQLEHLYRGLEQLLPVLEEYNMKLAIENLPTWEAFPTETEMEDILKHFGSPHLRTWHDIGHGRIRQNLGFINQERWLEKLSASMAGMHVHDVHPPGTDHVMPPKGHIDFSRLAKFGRLPILRVIEPNTRTKREDILAAHVFLKEVWDGNDKQDAEAATSKERT